MDPITLETTDDYYNFGGGMKSLTFTAHPKLDPMTGEMIAFGYEAKGFYTPDIEVFSADKTGKVLDLQFIDTHQPVRQLDDNGHYFACTDFRAAGSKDQIYDIDFWVTDRNGTMTVEQARVHKVPELKDGQWVEVPRYEWKDLGNSHVVP